MANMTDALQESQELPEKVRTGQDKNTDLMAFMTQFGEWFQRDQSRDVSWRQDSLESAAFYMGLPWTSREIDQLRKEEKPILNLNLVRPYINLITGIQISADTNLRVLATDPSNDEVSQALDKLIRHTEFRSKYVSIKAMSFRDGIVLGRGWREGYLDFANNPFGELKYGYVPPSHVRFDTYARMPDLSDMEYLFRSKWFSARTFQELFPDADDAPRIGEDVFEGWTEDDVNPLDRAPDDDSRQRVVEVWWREYRNRFFAMGLDGTSFRGFESEEDAENFINESELDAEVQELPTNVIRYAILSDKRWLVEPTDSPYGNRVFPYFPFFPDFFQGETPGLVEDMKDVQRIYSKTAAQALHIINQSANRPILMEEGSVDNAQVTANNMNRAGYPVTYKAGTAPPRWGEPPPFPSELFTFQDRAQGMAQFVTGLPPAVAGQAAGSREPARAAEMRKLQGQNVLVMAVNNWLQSEILRGLWTIDAAQRLLTEPHMIRIINEDEGVPEQQVQTIEFNQPMATAEGVVRVMNDLSVGQYDIRIDHVASSTALREDHLNKLIELSTAGAPIPSELIIRLMTGLPSDVKAEMITRTQQAAQQAAAAPGAQVQT